jgi:FMN-dependent NADH-azoreductase
MSNKKLNILKIDSSSRQETSVSRQLSKRVAARLLAENPNAEVVSRNVTSGLSPVSEDWITANFTPADDRSDDQKNILSLSDELVSELKQADIILIGLPIYNFGIPASLKAWVDLIARVGATFSYTEQGPQGLLSGKRVIVSVASGGVPVGSPVDFATTFLTHILGFIGITDVTYILATGLAMDAESTISDAEQQIDVLQLDKAA